MATVEIRPLADDEQEQAAVLWSQAFEKGDLEMEEWHKMEEMLKGRNITFGLFDAAGLQAAVLVTDCKLQFGPEVQVPMGAVGGVACLPAARGKGYAGDAIRYALERMREAGQVTSVLSPFSWSFYQNLGWDWTGVRRQYTVHSRVLRPDPETESVRASTPDDKPGIEALYTRFAGRYRGMLVRSEAMWKRLLEDRKQKHAYAFVYEKEGVMEGYLVFYGWKEEQTRIREFLTLTPRARRGLLGLLRRHEMQVKKFAWNAPPDDGLWNHFLDWKLETKLAPMQMARIVDVPGALACLQPGKSLNGAVRVAVRDTHAPWNARTWRIGFAEGTVEIAATADAPEIEMDIRQLTQAFFGAPLLEELRAAEIITVHAEAGYQALCSLLDGPPTWINDDF